MRPTTSSANLKSGQAMNVIKSVLPYLWPKSRKDIQFRVVLAMMALVLGEILGLLAPYFYGVSVDALAPGADEDQTIFMLTAGALGMVVAYGVMRILSVGFSQLRDVIFAQVGQRALRQLALETFRHMHRLSLSRVEARAKLPEGQGTWPAIWMLPSDPFKYASNCGAGTDWQGSDDCDAWPNSGEIDIMEHVGYDMNRVHGTVHTKAYYWVNGEQRKASIEAPAVNEGFNVYAMEWSAERIDVFLNNTLYFTYLKDSDDWQAWPFDHPFHVILNIAVGGGWGSAGGPTDLNAFPAKMEVDYVRIYKREGE